MLTTDKGKTKSNDSRAKQRAEDIKNRADDASSDTHVLRGFSTEQRLDIESLNIKKQLLFDRKQEQKIVAFSVEESALARQIEQAQRRSITRCLDYDSNNIHW